METILVPLDTSEIASKVLREAESLAMKLKAGMIARCHTHCRATESLAMKLKAGMILFHVIEPVASYIPGGASMDLIAAAPPELDNEQPDVARSRLEQLAAPLRTKGLDVACEATFGIPVDEILDQAKVRGANYIVLGSHGHGALFHLFGGSVVTGVLKRSVCPVVVVPVRK